MADSSSSRANLEAILRWCLRKQDEEESTGTTPMDREVLCTYQCHAPPTTRSGGGWGFVGDSSPKLVPRVGAFATQIAIPGHIVSDSRDK